MKKSLLFAIALFVLSLTSCEYCGCATDICLSESQVYENSGNIYDGSGYVYMSDSNLSTDKPALTETMLIVGSMRDGKLDIVLPENVDSLFLAKLEPDTSLGMYTEPQDVEVWLYEKPLIFVKNYEEMYIGDLEYRMMDENRYHKILYWYFSEDAKINHSYYNLETETFECEYNIDAKKGWNKVYFYESIANGRTCYTTDLSKVPEGLKWFFSSPTAVE
jgi:hypothetical protein